LISKRSFATLNSRGEKNSCVSFSLQGREARAGRYSACESACATSGTTRKSKGERYRRWAMAGAKSSGGRRRRGLLEREPAVAESSSIHRAIGPAGRSFRNNRARCAAPPLSVLAPHPPWAPPHQAPSHRPVRQVRSDMSWQGRSGRDFALTGHPAASTTNLDGGGRGSCRARCCREELTHLAHYTHLRVFKCHSATMFRGLINWALGALSCPDTHPDGHSKVLLCGVCPVSTSGQAWSQIGVSTRIS